MAKLSTYRQRLYDKIMQSSDTIQDTIPNVRTLQRAVKALAIEAMDRYDRLKKSRVSSEARTSFEQNFLRTFREIVIPKTATENDMKQIYRNLVRQAEGLKSFLSSRGSTVKGAREIYREQDARIFGTNDKGKPMFRMTNAQRKNMWRMYNDFKNMYGKYIQGLYTMSDALGYTRAISIPQYVFGRLAINGKKTLTPDEINHLINSIMLKKGLDIPIEYKESFDEFMEGEKRLEKFTKGIWDY